MKEGYPNEDIVRALRDASGLGGPGVEANATFRDWTIQTTRDSILALERLGYIIVPRSGMSSLAGRERTVRDHANG